MLNKTQYCEMVEKLADEAVYDHEERVANEMEIMAEKAAAVYNYALEKIAMAEEVYAEAEGCREECLEVLASAGMLDEDGIDKEAAEQDEDVYEATVKLASMHDDALERIAAAEEVYEEAMMEIQAAEEVLNSFGIEL